jgi:hypothetical protein
VYATAIGGQVHLLVPSGVAVVFGSLTGQPVGEPSPPPAPGVPVIELRTFVVAGKVNVRTPRPRSRGGWFLRRTR